MKQSTISLIKLYLKLYNKKKEIVTTFHYDKKELKDKPVIFLADHSSYNNGWNFLMKFPPVRDLKIVLTDISSKYPKFKLASKIIDYIPKTSVATDLNAAIKMYRALKEGSSLLILIEGMYSYCGTTFPVNPAVGGFLKNMGADVVMIKTKGAYFCQAFYNQLLRPGHVEVDYYHLFTPEDLKIKSPSEIYEEFIEQIKYNDFKWNAEQGYHYGGDLPHANKINNLLYYCPCCKSEGYITEENGLIVCKNCGNSIKMDDTYSISPATDKDSLPYDRLDKWYFEQRRVLRTRIQSDPDYKIELKVSLNLINEVEADPAFICIGEGMICLDRNGLKYSGTKNGEETVMVVPSEYLLSAVLASEHYIALRHDKEVYMLDTTYDKDNNMPTILVTNSAEELYALIDEQWDDALKRVYYS